MRRYRLPLILSLLIVLGGLLAACGGDPTPEPTDAGPEQPTLPPAPNWVEATEPMTIDSIARSRYLGRLDTPADPTTVFAYAFSPDSTRLAGLNANEVIVWDLIGGEVVWRTLRQNATRLYFSGDKTELYTLTAGGTVIVYDADGGVIKTDFLGQDGIVAADYDEDRDLLAIGGIDGTVKVWDTFERRSLVTLDAGVGDIATLSFAPDSEQIAIGGSGGMTLWRWADRERVAAISVNGQPIEAIAFHPQGTQIAIAGATQIMLWSPEGREVVHTLEAGEGIASQVLIYAPTGDYLVSGGDIPDMVIWDTASGRPAAQLPGVGGGRASAAFSPDGAMLLTATLEGPVNLWDVTSIGDTIAQAGLDLETDRVLFVDWTPDGYLMTFFDSLGPVYVWGIGGGASGGTDE